MHVYIKLLLVNEMTVRRKDFTSS